MFKILLRNRNLVFLILIAIFLKLFSLNKAWVEEYYTYGLYPVVSKGLRIIFGWIPFSIGDLVYTSVFIWLILKFVKFINLLRQRKLKKKLSWLLVSKYFKLILGVYIIFNLFWGLNYYRQGIEKQLAFKLEPYSTDDLFALTTVLQEHLNNYAEKIDSLERMRYDDTQVLFDTAADAYKQVSRQYPFLSYSNPSIKPSLFTTIGHWFGFTGYYNPFSAEAQLKTTIPVFLKPFVITHELAHQLGYAKEDEASFVAYLTCKSDSNIYFLYSAYFEMYRDGLFACFGSLDAARSIEIFKNQHERVKRDFLELRRYNAKNKNIIEPVMSGAYDKYLKLNNQPKGKATYDEVIAYLIAYMKKFGKEAI